MNYTKKYKMLQFPLIMYLLTQLIFTVLFFIFEISLWDEKALIHRTFLERISDLDITWVLMQKRLHESLKSLKIWLRNLFKCNNFQANFSLVKHYFFIEIVDISSNNFTPPLCQYRIYFKNYSCLQLPFVSARSS